MKAGENECEKTCDERNAPASAYLKKVMHGRADICHRWLAWQSHYALFYVYQLYSTAIFRPLSSAGSPYYCTLILYLLCITEIPFVMTTATLPAGIPPAANTKYQPRKSTLARKREDDDLLEPSSPSKRSKVSFDSDVEVRLVEEWEKTPTVIQEGVRRALLKRATGDSTGYERVKAIYTPVKDGQDEPGPATVKSHTFALLNNVSMLNRGCADLVHAVLSSDWLGRSEEYVHLFTQFLANLVSAQSLYLADVLGMLAENITAGRLYPRSAFQKILS